MTQEALKHVLYLLNKPDTARQSENVRPAEDFIKEALAQTEQEPVAWFSPSGNLYKTRFHATANGEQVVTPLYTAPPQRTWVDLTEAERIDIIDEEITAQGIEHFALAQAIEAKLKEKNT